MKKFILVFALVFAFVGVASAASVVTGTPGSPLTLQQPVTIQVTGIYDMTILSFSVEGATQTFSADLDGAWDFGTLDPSVILEAAADNPYGAGALRTGSSHFVDARVFVNNNSAGWVFTINVVGDVFDLPPSANSAPGDTAIHWGTQNISTVDTVNATQVPANLDNVMGTGAFGPEGFFALVNGSTNICYDTTGVIQSDAFSIMAFCNNVDPNFPGSAITDGTITYAMTPAP